MNAVWNTATDVPVTASGYAATGNTVSFTLNFAPATGTDLTVVKNTGLDFISGTFDNLHPRSVNYNRARQKPNSYVQPSGFDMLARASPASAMDGWAE